MPPLREDNGKLPDFGYVPALMLPSATARYLIIYFHSNGEDLGACYPFLRGVRAALEVHILAVEFPGYGLCGGEATEENLARAATAAFHFATNNLGWPREDIIVMGRSLGAAVAARLTASLCENLNVAEWSEERPKACHGLVLIAPFASLTDVFGQFLPGGRSGRLSKHLVEHACGGETRGPTEAFNNRSHIKKVSVPLLIVHGRKDSLVSVSQSEELIKLSRNPKRLLVAPMDMSHNANLLSQPQYLLEPMLDFFNLPDYSFQDFALAPELFQPPPWCSSIVRSVGTAAPRPEALDRSLGDIDDPMLRECNCSESEQQLQQQPLRLQKQHQDFEDLDVPDEGETCGSFRLDSTSRSTTSGEVLWDLEPAPNLELQASTDLELSGAEGICWQVDEDVPEFELGIEGADLQEGIAQFLSSLEGEDDPTLQTPLDEELVRLAL